MHEITLGIAEPKPGNSARRVFWGAIMFSLLFTAVIYLAGQRLNSVTLLPDQGATWYLWKLPRPTFWSQATAWGGYVLHQLFMWGTIFYARKNVAHYSSGLNRVNIIALFGNAMFAILHLLQSQFWYDGLAQNVPLQSSEASVVLLLVIVLVMENRRRGLFFGRPVPISRQVVDFFRHYHGYIFAWAIAYTFWFHPMVNTPGHLIGFFYILLLLVQGSLFFTRLHLNRWWTVTLELLVLVHGALVVSMLRGTGVWAFVLGFLGIFLVTQMHGLNMPAWARWSVLSAYILAVIAAFSARGPAVGRDIVLVPLLEYGLVLMIAIVVWAGLRLHGRLRA